MPLDRVAVIPYRRKHGNVEVLMVTSRETRRWIFPKGHVEAHLGPQASAIQEAYEEAGVRGIIEYAPLGDFVSRAGERQHTLVYLFQVTRVLASWPEMRQRERRWLLIPEAMKLAEEAVRPLLMLAAELLD